MSDIKLSSLFGITGYPMRSGLSNFFNISPFTYTAVTTYPAPTYNDNGWFNTTTGRFTPQVAGYYQINYLVAYSQTPITASSAQSLIYKNTASWSGASIPSSIGYPTAQGSDIIFLNGTTDYLQLYAYHTSSSTYVGASGAFSAVLVSNQ